MKKYALLVPLTLLLLPLLAQMTLPRMYIQKLALDNGKNPSITWQKDKSANEYILKAWINTRPEEVLSTETHPLHTIAVKQVGDGIKFPFTVIASLQLGNFRNHWKAGEVIMLEITHKKSGQKFSWRQPIPEGTALIKMLDKPIIIPPFKKFKK